MMKKTMLVMLAVLLAAGGILLGSAPRTTGASRAEAAAEDAVTLSGIVTEVREDQLLMTDDTGRRLQVMLKDTTRLEAEEPLQPGDFVRVTYNGLMSRSVPAIIGADVIACHRLRGTVQEKGEGSLLLRVDESTTRLILTDEAFEPGTLITVCCESTEGDALTALYVRGPELCGTITGVMEEGFLLDTGSEEVTVLLNDDTILGVQPEAGLAVRVAVTGAMTLSLPAQYTASLVLLQ